MVDLVAGCMHHRKPVDAVIAPSGSLLAVEVVEFHLGNFEQHAILAQHGLSG